MQKKNKDLKNISEKKNIFIFGGSQGSVNLIEKVILILKKINNLYDVNLIFQCPKQITNKLDMFLKERNFNYTIHEYIDNIDDILFSTDIAFTRAGAGTISNIINYNIPSIILPISNSIYNHQFYNAKYLTDINAAILMDENNFNADINANIFIKLITNDNFYKDIKKELEKINIENANLKMLNIIENEKNKSI